MRRTFLIILNLCLLFFIVSCEKPIIEEKIPIDSLYFTGKINGELFTLKSPEVTSGSGGSFFQRLYKLKNSPKDSVIIGFFNSFQNDSIRITISFSKCFLADTTSYDFLKGHQYKYEIYSTGSYDYQYVNPSSGFITTSAQKVGFYIEIWNMKKHITYTSNLDDVTGYIKTNYNEFKNNSSCQITKSITLDSGIYSDYRNALFMESNFNCKLFENGVETNNSISLTEGHLNGVF